MRSLLSTLMMLLASSLLILQGDSLALQLPPSVKESVTSCRGAVQDVLKSRKSRITVDFPPFTDYQIKSKSKAATKSSTPSTPDLYALHSSNQALAQLFVEMFQPLGPKSITVCFNTLDLAEQATREWDKNVCNIVNLGKGQSVPTKAKSKKAKSPGKAKGFMKAIEEVSEDDPQPSLLCGVLPPATECCIVVNPSPVNMAKLKRLHSELGQDVLLIILNGRRGSWSSPESSSLFDSGEWVDAFSLVASADGEMMQHSMFNKGAGL
ncbi:hypothetical protein TrST_g5556 [Triparma strigata]|uniref:DUF1995 domain-containing protein n=1 Tax=Triparma strigata TaxID=1606541 RepID=A0A9W7B9M8_9STRA|nr:hypothetical protein TrST_g5556 [Triparma strigata]